MSVRARVSAAWPLAFPALVVVATLLAYIPAIRGGFIWDDDFYVTDNATLHDADGLRRIWLDPSANPQYYPLTFTSFWVEKHLWGAAPLGYHLVNVLLHAASSVLLWQLLRRIGIPGAALAAAIFAVHPVEVESVAWVTERKNALSGFFYLASALVYWSCASEGTRRTAWRVFAVVLFVCALLSKSTTASLPVALALVLIWKRGRLKRHDLAWLGAMLAVGALAGLFTAHLEQSQVGAEGGEWSLSLLGRLLLSARIFWFYLGKLVWPVGLAFFYERWTIDVHSLAQWLFPLATAALFAALVLTRRRIGAGPLVAFVFYGMTLSPALGFLNVFPMRYSWVADHFQYLASIGPIALFATVATRSFVRVGPRLPQFAAALLVTALGGLTWRQAGTYRDAEALWRATVATTPKAWAAHAALANLLDEQGHLDEAAAHHLMALAAKPDLVDSMANLAAIRVSQGRPAEAVEWCERALRIDPGHVVARYDLAVALAATGSVERAIAELREVVRTSSEPVPTSGMAAVLHARGFVGLQPGKARAGLARLLAQQGRIDESIAEYRRALEEQSEMPEAWTDLGILLESQGRVAEAPAAYTSALRLDPTFEPARARLTRLRSPGGSVQGDDGQLRRIEQPASE